MHDEIEYVARAFYSSNDDARGWEREPQTLKQAFRLKAKLVINTLNGFRQQTSSSPSSLPHSDLPGFFAVLSGPHHVFHVANKAHRHLTGHRAVMDKPIREVIPELKEQGYLDIIQEVFETGQPYVGCLLPLRIRTRRNGPLEDRLVDVAYKPINSVAGERLGIIVEGRDVTHGSSTSP